MFGSHATASDCESVLSLVLQPVTVSWGHTGWSGDVVMLELEVQVNGREHGV